MDQSAIARLVDHIKSREGPGLVFVCYRREAEELAATLTGALGYEVEWVTAERPLSLRKRLVQRMKDGDLKLAVCTSTWSTGIDIPALRFVALTGKDKAPIGVLQEVGRALRVHGDARFEIINLIEPGLEQQGKERLRVLVEHGFETEGSFLDELEAQPVRPPSGLTAGAVLDYAILFAIGGIILYFIQLSCGVTI